MIISGDNAFGNNDFCDIVKIYYNDLKWCKPIPRDEERKLIRLAKKGDLRARNKVLSANLRFVFDVARKYKGHGVDMPDLISEGNRGMIWAMEKFDETKNVKFFTYAVWWIRQYIQRAIEANTKGTSFESRIEEEFCRNKSKCSEGITDEENVYDDEEEDFDDSTNAGFEDSEFNSFVSEKLLAKLDDRRRLVITEYFGMNGNGDGKTCKEIGKQINLSTERVRQLKVSAISDLRHEAMKLKDSEVFIRR